MSWFDAEGLNEELKVAHCWNAACTQSSVYVVDTNGYVGEGSSIAIGTDGLGLISYADRTNNSLKVSHLSNRFGIPYHRTR